jgi:TolB-like protein
MFGFIGNQNLFAAEKWHKAYANGLEAMNRGDWRHAVTQFEVALAQKRIDTGKTRAYGTVFIEYFPNREIGICYYHLGETERARRHLQLSLQQSASARAREYLQRLEGGLPAEDDHPESKTEPQPMPAESAPTTLVGERLNIAILPFVAKGIGGELGSVDLLDKLTTVFVNLNRFKVIERAQLEKILEEQKLGLTGIVDVSTAAQIGKGIGVDAVVCGSLVRAGNSASIDARLIDTETAAIITAKDAFSNSVTLSGLSQMISEVAGKIKGDLPLVTGYVIKLEGERITLDLGRAQNVRRGMKCHIYREGEPIVHPVTNQVIGKAIVEVCEVLLVDVFEGYSIATMVKSKNGAPQVRDRAITK